MLLQCGTAEENLPWTTPRRERIHDDFLRGYYREDPLFAAISAGLLAGCYTPAMFSRHAYTSTSFYRNFLRRAQVAHEIDYVIPTDSGAIVVWIGRNTLQGSFDGDLEPLTQIEPFLRCLIFKHLELTAGSRSPEEHYRTKLDQAQRRFGSSILTMREHAVLRWLLQGYSTRAIARKLAIAPNTVKNHRKSIHHKLEIRSQAELLSLFLQALPFVDADGDSDPFALISRRVRQRLSLPVPASLPPE